MDANKKLLYSTYQERLHSFSSNPLPPEHETSCMKLAEAGFERQSMGSSSQSASDEVYCRMCGLKFSGWSGLSPLAVHRTLSPNCLFLNTPSSKALQGFSSQSLMLESGNTHMKEDKIDSSKDGLINFRRQLVSRQLSPLYDILALRSRMEDVPEIQHPFEPKRGNFLMLFESHRLLTFENPLSTEAAVYAKAGFVYDKNLRCTVCVFCSFEVEFTPQEEIMLEIFHEDKSPSCPFTRGYDVGNVSRIDECLIRERVRDTFFNACCGKQDEGAYSVKHPEYVEKSSRLGTFKSWPPLQASQFPDELMVDCGFYYTNFMDSVRCFSCGIGLRKWTKGADPFAQHAKASPNCWHILKLKGQEFVDVAQSVQLTIEVDYREVQDGSSDQDRAANSSSTVTSSPSSPSPSSLPSSMSVGSPHLDLDSIKAAMACQYTIEQIADAVIKFFVSSCGRYPNEDLLIGTLRAADVNHKVVCDQQQEIIKTHSELQETKSELQSQRKVVEATKSELARTQYTLQWQNLELRTELEQRFLGQIEQQNEVLQHKDEVIYQKDEVIQQNREVIQQNREALQNNAIQLELKNREVEDLQRQLKSVLAALEKKEKEDKKDESTMVNEVLDKPQTRTVHGDEFPVANCKVCLTNTSQIVFYPCKHLCCCDACATRLIGQSCPICREPNLTMEKVYVI